MEAKTGGFKDLATSSVYKRQHFTGLISRRTVNVTFDLEAPTHCTETDTCIEDYVLPVDVGMQIDKSVSSHAIVTHSTGRQLKDQLYYLSSIFTIILPHAELNITTHMIICSRALVFMFSCHSNSIIITRT